MSRLKLQPEHLHLFHQGKVHSFSLSLFLSTSGHRLLVLTKGHF